MEKKNEKKKKPNRPDYLGESRNEERTECLLFPSQRCIPDSIEQFSCVTGYEIVAASVTHLVF